jgi:cytochrome d ubiquinol oxidase subunit II
MTMIDPGGTFWELFSPFALLCGLVSVTMMVMHGAAWLACKTEGDLRRRARAAAGLAMIVLFVLGGVRASRLDFYVIQHFAGVGEPSNPLGKQVMVQAGALMSNYAAEPWTLAAPVVALVAAAAAIALTRSGRRAVLAFVCSGFSIAGVIATAGVSMFPFMMPSSLDPNSSLTLWDASSGLTTLIVMTVVTVVLLPVVLAYTAWIYYVLRGPVTAEQITRDSHTAY